MSGTLIQPLKINKPSGRTVPEINISGDFGVERKLADEVRNLFEKKQKLDQIQGETFGQQFAASMSKLILDRDNRGKVDKKLFYTTEAYDSLNAEIKSNIETFKKEGTELGLDNSILEKYSSMVTGELEKSNTNYLANYMEHNEKVIKDEAGRLIKMKADNLSSVAMLGDYQGAVKGFYSVAKDLDNMIQNEYISGEKAINLATEQRQNIIVSYVSSFVNRDDGKSTLQDMSTWTTDRFLEEFSDLNFKNDTGEFYLTVDDYNKFQSTVSSGLTRISNKEKLNKQNTMVEKLKYEQKKKTNPLEVALTEDQISADGYIPESTMVKAINYKNGVLLTGIKEALNLGYSIPWKEKGLNDTTDIYKNPSLTGEGIVNFRQKEAELLANSYGYDAIKNFYDTTDESIIGGSMFMETYNTNMEFKKEFDNIYSSENRKILAEFDKVKVTDFSLLKDFNTEFRQVVDSNYITPTSYMSGTNGIRSQKIVSVATGAKIAGLEMAANNGSLAAIRATQDISKMASDALILEVYSNNGGIITDDLADKGELKDKYIGQPISSLTPEQQQQFFKNILNNDKKIRENINYKIEGVINSMTDGMDTINIGNNKTIFVPKIIKAETTTNFITGQEEIKFYHKERDIEKTQNTINEILAKNTYKANINGTLKEIGDKKNISFVQDIGDTKIRLFYAGQPVLTDNGYAVLDIEEFIKEE